MEYAVEFLDAAVDELNALPIFLQGIVDRYIDALARAPFNTPNSEDCDLDHHAERRAWFEVGPIDGHNHYVSLYYNVDSAREILEIAIIAYHAFPDDAPIPPMH